MFHYMSYLKILFIVILNSCFIVFGGYAQPKVRRSLISAKAVALNYKGESDTIYIPVVSDKYPELKKALSYKRILFDKDLETVVNNYDTCRCGIVGANYAVTFENKDVVSIKLYYSMMDVYPDNDEEWLTLNIHTGKVYVISNEVNAAGMKWLLDHYRAALKRRIEDKKDDIMNDDNGTNIYNELNNAVNDIQGDDLLKKYVFTDKGVQFSIERILPHAVTNFEPDEEWLVPYGKLNSFKMPGAVVLK